MNLDRCGYKITRHLGSGGFGVVKSVKKGSEFYAAKILNFENGISNLSEIDIMSKIIHKNINQCYEIITPKSCIFSSDLKIVLITKLGFSDLENVTKSLSFKDKVNILYQVAQAIKIIHQEKILHNDIKEKNIIIEKTTRNYRIEYNAFLTDFGLSTLYFDNYSQFLGTHMYVAPEVRESLTGYLEYTPATDVWSYGITCLRVFSNQNIPIMYNNLQINTFHKILIESKEEVIKNFIRNYVEDEKLQVCINFLSLLLEYNPTQRLKNFETILNHEIFSGIEIVKDYKIRTLIPREYLFKDYDRGIVELIYKCTDELNRTFTYLNLEKISVFIFFLAVDIVYTTYDIMYKRYSNFKELRNLFIITCFWIAVKYTIKDSKFQNLPFILNFFNSVNHLGNFSNDAKMLIILNLEVQIVEDLKGIIYNRFRIYDLCKDANEVKIAFNLILQRNPTEYSYFKLDETKWNETVNISLRLIKKNIKEKRTLEFRELKESINEEFKLLKLTF
ncbi:MAG: protein kinase [Candidatus Woesearchaeota archaeon]